MGHRSQASHFNMIHSKCEAFLPSVCDCVCYSKACSIPDEESVIITGGEDTLTTVSVYTVEGWQKDLPNLNTRRYYHACSSYSTDERRVR